MKLTLKNILPALLLACSPLVASAMSLGEGQIISQVGDPFSATIALVGTFDKNIKFHLVRGSECRSSLINKIDGGCDYVYEGKLGFSVRKNPNGQFFLRLDGERDDNLFYRVIIRYQSPSTGSFYKAFDFLPEFKGNGDTLPAPSDDNDITTNTSLPPVKGGALMGNVVGLPSEAGDKSEPLESSRNLPGHRENAPVGSGVADSKAVDKAKQSRSNFGPKTKPVSQAKRQPNNMVAPQLLIRKEGSIADEIFSLQKENEVIEQQIALLEKQITLLREVARLKTLTYASSVPAIAVDVTPTTPAPESGPVIAQASAQVPIRVTAKIPSQATKQSDDSGFDLLNWVLIAAALLLLALLSFLYIRQKKPFHNYNLTEFKPVMVSPASDDHKESLDLTGKTLN